MIDIAREFLSVIFVWVSVPLLVYFLVGNAVQLLLVILAVTEHSVRTAGQLHMEQQALLSSRAAPGITVVAAMYNEAAGIVVAAQAMLTLNYPDHEVVLVDDGSKDDTFEVLRTAYDLVQIPHYLPRDIATRQTPHETWIAKDRTVGLTVLRKANSGRADSLNCGVNAARKELVVFVDADSILDPDALLAVAKPFADDPSRVVATGGVIRVVNGARVVNGRVLDGGKTRGWLAQIQSVEYLRAFHLGRLGWSRLNSLLLISGAFGMFRRDTLVEVGGLDPDSIGEDFELVLRIHRTMRDQGQPYRVSFVSEPICWTECPSTWKVLGRQRSRWHRGLWETLVSQRGMLLNPRYGRLGLLALPHYWIFELFAPVVEGVGLILVAIGLAMGVVNAPYLVAFTASAYLFAMLVTLSAAFAETIITSRQHHRRRLAPTLLASFLEQAGYRQITIWFRLKGWWSSLSKQKATWGEMTRTGFTASASSLEGTGTTPLEPQ